jgi:hypothetical protein
MESQEEKFCTLYIKFKEIAAEGRRSEACSAEKDQIALDYHL